eukprot:189525_1
MAAFLSVTVKAVPIVVTTAISVTRKWIKERSDKSIIKLVSEKKKEKNTSFDEESIAKHEAISTAISKQLDEIKREIGILRNKDFESAKSFFAEALRWRHKPDAFKKYIELSYDKCIEAKKK